MDDVDGHLMKNKVTTLPKENTNEVKDWMQEAGDDAKDLLDTGDFQLSHQKNPCYRSLMKIH